MLHGLQVAMDRMEQPVLQVVLAEGVRVRHFRRVHRVRVRQVLVFRVEVEEEEFSVEQLLVRRLRMVVEAVLQQVLCLVVVPVIRVALEQAVQLGPTEVPELEEHLSSLLVEL